MACLKYFASSQLGVLLLSLIPIADHAILSEIFECLREFSKLYESLRRYFFSFQFGWGVRPSPVIVKSHIFDSFLFHSVEIILCRNNLVRKKIQFSQKCFFFFNFDNILFSAIYVLNINNFSGVLWLWKYACMHSSYYYWFDWISVGFVDAQWLLSKVH